MKELGVQMIPAYSPQARGRSERSFGTWQGRLPQELRLANITTVEAANEFLRNRYVAEFNARFAVAAEEKGTAFRRSSRSDLNWIFTIQTERVVATNTWIERYRFVSDPMLLGVSKRTDQCLRKPKNAVEKAGAWKAAKTKNRFPPPPPLPWKSR